MKLSLVVPCFNEAENVAVFQAAVINAFEGCGYEYEIIFIDDGSLMALSIIRTRSAAIVTTRSSTGSIV